MAQRRFQPPRQGVFKSSQWKRAARHGHTPPPHLPPQDSAEDCEEGRDRMVPACGLRVSGAQPSPLLHLTPRYPPCHHTATSRDTSDLRSLGAPCMCGYSRSGTQILNSCKAFLPSCYCVSKACFKRHTVTCFLEGAGPVQALSLGKKDPETRSYLQIVFHCCSGSINIPGHFSSFCIVGAGLSGESNIKLKFTIL